MTKLYTANELVAQHIDMLRLLGYNPRLQEYDGYTAIYQVPAHGRVRTIEFANAASVDDDSVEVTIDSIPQGTILTSNIIGEIQNS